MLENTNIKTPDPTTSQLLQMDPEELLNWVYGRFYTEIPVGIETKEDVEQAGKLLSMCTANYSYLSHMTLMAKFRKRSLKQLKASAQEISDALSREEIFDMERQVIKATYDAVSRMITAKQMSNEELRFTDGRR